MKHSIAWQGNLSISVDDQADGAAGWRRVRMTTKVDGEFSMRGSLALGRVEKPFWCAPGLFWGDNLQDKTRMLYAKFDPTLDKPRAFVSAYWQFHISRLIQPLVGCHDGRGWRVLQAEPYATSSATVEPVAISLGFAYRDGAASLLCSLPPVEEPYRATGTDYTEPKTGLLAAKKGDWIEWRYRFVELTGERATLLDFLAAAYHGASEHDRARPSAAPIERVAQATRNGLMRWHHHPEGHHFKYVVAYDRIGQQIAEGSGCTLDQSQMFLGWVSGWVVFEPLLDYAARFDDPEPREAVSRIWDHLRATVRSPSGFWWSRYAPRYVTRKGVTLGNLFDGGQFNGWDGGWLSNKRHIHLRTTGDAVLRATRVLEKHAKALPFSGSLLDDVVRQAGLVADMARKNPILPLSIDAVSGEIQPLSGTGAMIWISVWSRLARMKKWDDLEIIRKCADAYRPRVAAGSLYGAPEDIGECTSSEDVYIAVNVYADLYELFQRPEDLATCIQAARWLYLWRCSWKTWMPPRSILGVYQLNSRGGDLASSKNNHYHIYGLDADEALHKLADWTNDRRWNEMADDHWRFSSDLVCLEDGQFNGYEGMLSEQYYFMDWSCLGNSVYRFETDDRQAAWDVGPHFRNRGNLAGFSTAWCVGMVLRTALERLKRG